MRKISTDRYRGGFKIVDRMGVSYEPGLVYGFKTEDTVIESEAFHSLPFCSKCYPQGHVSGKRIYSFEDYKQGKNLEDAKRFGELMKKYFGIECDYYMVQSGDACYEYCDANRMSFLEWIRDKKPEWSLKECKRVGKEIGDYYEDEDEEGKEGGEEESEEENERDEDESSSEALHEDDEGKEKKEDEGKDLGDEDENESKKPKVEPK